MRLEALKGSKGELRGCAPHYCFRGSDRHLRSGCGKSARLRQRAGHVARADLTAGFLEAVATAALQSRLRSHSLVKSSIECDGWGLLSGRVNSVAIAGRDWISPLGLSARVLEVSLGQAALDVPAIMQKQRIYLLGVPSGVGRIVFSAAQFATFLQHPLMLAAAATAVQGQRFVFDRDTVHYDLAAGILMSGVWQGDGQRYSLTMQPAGGAAVVTAAHQQHPQDNPEQTRANAAFVGEALSAFFSALTLDLQGPELSYDGMRLVPGHALPAQPGILPLRLAGALPPLRPAEPVLDLRLAVRVLGFPPSNPQF